MSFVASLTQTEWINVQPGVKTKSWLCAQEHAASGFKKKPKPEKVTGTFLLIWSESVLDEGLTVTFNKKRNVSCHLMACAEETNSSSDYFYLLSPEVKPIESLLCSNSNSSWQTVALVSVGAAAPDTTSSRNEKHQNARSNVLRRFRAQTSQPWARHTHTKTHRWTCHSEGDYKTTHHVWLFFCSSTCWVCGPADVLMLMDEIQSGLQQATDWGCFM